MVINLYLSLGITLHVHFSGMTMIVNGESAGVLGMNQPDCISNSRCWGVVGVSPAFQHFLPATTAHEFAHAFGVQHDSDSKCCLCY